VQRQSRAIPKCISAAPWILVLLAIFATSCGSKPEPKVAGPVWAGTTLRVNCPNGPARTLIDRHAAGWARLQKVTLSVGDFPDADVFVFGPGELGRLAEGGILAPLPDSVTGSELWTGQLRLYRNKLLLWGATPYALPILGDATFVIYREDVFRAAKRKPPTSFAEFAATARQFFDERKRSVLPALPADDDNLDRLFHVVAAAFAVMPVNENDFRRRSGDTSELFAFHRDVTSGAPRLTDPGFVAALDWLKNLAPLRAKTGTLAETFAADDAVMAFGSLADLASLQPATHPGRYSVAPICSGPAGERVPYIGPDGAFIGLAKKAKNQSAALALAQHLTGPTVSFEVVHDPVFGSAPFRNVHLSEHRDGWFNYGLDAIGTATLLEALREVSEPRAINAPFRMRMPDQMEYRKVLLDGVRHCLADDGESAKALKDIDARWQEMDAAHPMDRKTMYLKSLTLRR
jgi:ABC-type glycerol-3-phosphate transport system substrate-binding protein